MSTASHASAAIRTAKVTARRPVSFHTIDDVLCDIDRLEAADREGRLRCQGNWTAGQNLGHVAAWINYAYDGFPMAPPPWPIRLILRWILPRYLRRGMPAGVQIPGVKGGTTGCDPLSFAEGAARLRQALRRLASDEFAPHASPAFGPMPPDRRRQLNLRHAELHLSFLTIDDAAGA